MPELSRFAGMSIKLLYSDDDKHHKPHVHVYYSDCKASIGLDGELLSGKLPPKKLTLIQAWIILHENELYEAWNKAVKNETFNSIEPLR